MVKWGFYVLSSSIEFYIINQKNNAMKIFKKIRIKYYILIGLISVSLNFTNAQNTCATATSINLPTQGNELCYNGTTVDRTASFGNSFYVCSGNGQDTWVVFTTPAENQWRVDFTRGTIGNGVEINLFSECGSYIGYVGCITTNFTFDMTLAPNTTYRLMVYNGRSGNNTGRGTFSLCFKSLYVPLELIQQPQPNEPVCLNTQHPPISVETTGGSSVTYQWYVNTINSNENGTLIDGATSNTYQPQSNTAGTFWYYCVIEDIYNTIVSETTKAHVIPYSQNIISVGDFVWTGSISSNWESSSNWYVFNGSTYEQSSSIPTAYDVVVIPSNSICYEFYPILNNQSATVKEIIIEVGGILKLEDNATITTLEDIVIESGGRLELGNGSIHINGSWYNYGEFISNTGTVSFVGNSGNDTLFNQSTNNEFYNLVVNKSNGELVLNDNIKVSNELSIEQGNFRLNQKIIDLDRTGFITNEGDGHRVFCDCPSAYIRKVVDIPINTTINPGNLGLTITTTNKQMGETVIKRRHQRAEELNGIYRIFDVTPQFNGNLNLTLEFQYFTTEVEDLSLQSTFAIYRSTDDGGNWNEEGGFNMIDDKTVIITGWNEFSWITVAPSQNGSALPVELLEFKATLVNNQVELNWTTVTEINNEKFEIERSVNGTDFTKIGEKQGANNSTSTNHYKYSDEYLPNSDIVYYRLKQIDFDGKFEYSKIVSVFLNQNLIIEYFNLLGQRIQIPYNGAYIKVIKSNNYIISTSLIKN